MPAMVRYFRLRYASFGFLNYGHAVPVSLIISMIVRKYGLASLAIVPWSEWSHGNCA